VRAIFDADATPISDTASVDCITEEPTDEQLDHRDADSSRGETELGKHTTFIYQCRDFSLMMLDVNARE
jgi:hypothetical protein